MQEHPVTGTLEPDELRLFNQLKYRQKRLREDEYIDNQGRIRRVK